MAKTGYNGYLLSEVGRYKLLGHIMPAHERIVAHHVTHEFGVEDGLLPPFVDKVAVTHHAWDENVQAVVVEVNGRHKRPDGSIYHITVSLAGDAKPVSSNGLLADRTNWAPLITPFEIEVTPEFFSFQG